MPNDELIIVDYKATSKDGNVVLDSDWSISYKRQMDIYRWFCIDVMILKSIRLDILCIVTVMQDTFFDKKFEFDIKLIPYEGDDSWVEGTFGDLY